MEIINNNISLRQAIRGQRALGKRIALVPTMGALHAGHISLVKQALQHADWVAVSIFVNPTQFGPNEDFDKYPRTLEADIQALAGSGAECVYTPSVAQMYPQGATTRVAVGQELSSQLCGAFRPGHFDGVATIVTKLFMQAQPDVAIFGEKDFQQLAIIRRITADLDIPVQVIGSPILREADGLAMSSRNRYLSEPERAIATAMYSVLKELSASLRGSDDTHTSLNAAKAALLAAGFTKVDYVELCDSATLAPLTALSAPARLLAAAYIGTTRLIDNIEVLP